MIASFSLKSMNIIGAAAGTLLEILTLKRKKVNLNSL